MNWKPYVKVEGEWTTNSLVFATPEEALASAKNLMGRWMLVTDYSSSYTRDPVNYELDLRTGVCTPLPTIGVVA